MDFAKRYANLNAAQKHAVDTIDGPVMVIAGPGTGKTELISMRVANILQKTDTLPGSILCLTFTESGADAMRRRLTDIIGKDAYKVAVHTFHSFGTETINQNPEYFYQGAHFQPADELSTYKVIQEIFSKLKHNDPLSSKQNDEYTHLSDAIRTISEIKRSGFNSDELIKILDRNDVAIKEIEDLLSPIFSNRISKATVNELTKTAEHMKRNVDYIAETIVPLTSIAKDSLESAIAQATETNSTKPITAWRNEWFKKDDHGDFVLKSKDRQKKLRSLCNIYQRYIDKMEALNLFDFDDMILQLVQAMEHIDDLRFNVQEKYLYIMVDEFQDTNLAQMRILNNLTNNDVQGDTPNIMVVGDDDQAIYSFQGADISNVLTFRDHFPKSKLITLTENYRSTKDILNGARQIICQGHDRLENKINELNKDLSVNVTGKTDVKIIESETIVDERNFIVNDIKSRISSGIKPNDIAVLTRRHFEINSLLPYFSDAKILVNYEKRDNALDNTVINLIEKIAKVLIDLSKGRHDEVNARLPELLAHKVWGIAAVELWRLSCKAYEKRTRWLDEMALSPNFVEISNWLITNSKIINDTPVEQMLDIIIGHPNLVQTDQYVSPIFNHYFSRKSLENSPEEYVAYLEALRTIRSKLREYLPDKALTISDYIDFIDLNRKVGSTISVIRRSTTDENAINLMTVHRSKGLEFDSVYVFNAVDNMWGEKARSRNRLINFPENLPFAPAGETEDERLRLFYVAATRAKKNLTISYALNDDSGKGTVLASYLIGNTWPTQKIKAESSKKQQIKQLELDWYQPLVDPVSKDMKNVLSPILDNYKLSVTHFNSFLDVTRGGPYNFLLQNLLRFPQAKTPSAAYGTAIHETLRLAHNHLVATKSAEKVDDIIKKFENCLKNQRLAKHDFEHLLQKGKDNLTIFLNATYSSFNQSQQPELDFNNQSSIVGTAHITGKLDVVEFDKINKLIRVTDYKTGKPAQSWSGKDDYEKIKLHKYKQQLMFYKLLIEKSRDYQNFEVNSGCISFIEPTPSNGAAPPLEIEFKSEELERLKHLINAVWDKITNLQLPDTKDYDKSYKGILKFEQDLLDNIV